jgi:hypothetical protein
LVSTALKISVLLVSDVSIAVHFSARRVEKKDTGASGNASTKRFEMFLELKLKIEFTISIFSARVGYIISFFSECIASFYCPILM